MNFRAISLGMALGLLFGAFAQPALAAESVPELVIYAYDSFAAPGGLGPEIIPLFEKNCACRVRVLPVGDAGQLLTRLQLDAERKKVTAQLVLGVDQYLWKKARPLLEPWSPAEEPLRYRELRPELRVEPGFLPFDYGILSLMADLEQLKKLGLSPPRSVRELLLPQWKKRFILQNPKTSTPGLAFLILTQEVLRQDVWDYWAKLRDQWLLMAPGWDGAYGLFLRGEAPLVWSYLTSQAYHREHGDQGRYQAVIFDEGQPLQIEGAAVIRGAIKTSEERRLVRAFLEFLLSDEVQSRVPLKNWMLPVLNSQSRPLPESFTSLPAPRKLVGTGTAHGEASDLVRWSAVVQTGSAGESRR